MKKILLLLFTTLCAGNLYAQSVTGDWNGALNINGTSLHLVFHIQKVDEGYKTTFDSPDQGAKGLVADKTTVTGSQITIEAAQYGIKYTAKVEEDSS